MKCVKSQRLKHHFQTEGALASGAPKIKVQWQNLRETHWNRRKLPQKSFGFHENLKSWGFAKLKSQEKLRFWSKKTFFRKKISKSQDTFVSSRGGFKKIQWKIDDVNFLFLFSKFLWFWQKVKKILKPQNLYISFGLWPRC